MILTQPIAEYLNTYHPDVLKEMEVRLQSQPCSDGLVELVYNKAMQLFDEKWQVQLITIASVLALCSPETLYIGCRVRLGVAKSLSVALGVSQQRVSQKFLSASHYFKNITWCREASESIIHEIRSNKEDSI